MKVIGKIKTCQIFNSHLKLSKLLTQYFPLVSETEQSLWMTEFRRCHSADWSWSWIRIVMWGLYCARIGCFCRTWNSELNLWSHGSYLSLIPEKQKLPDVVYQSFMVTWSVLTYDQIHLFAVRKTQWLFILLLWWMTDSSDVFSSCFIIRWDHCYSSHAWECCLRTLVVVSSSLSWGRASFDPLAALITCFGLFVFAVRP